MSSKLHQKLPVAWESTTIGEITLPYKTIQPKKHPDSEFKYIDIGSIDNSNQTITNPKTFLGKDAPSRARRVVKQGDVVFSTVRTYLKNIACVPDELDEVLTSTGIAVLRTTSEIKNNFLFYYVSSDEFIRKISGKMDGTLYPAVTDNDVYAAPIPLPPFNEQKRIVTKIEALQTRSTAVKEELEAIKPLLNQFRQSVLAAAFRGDLTKDWRKQNPDVEPAEVLLERIRGDRRSRWEEAELEKMKAKGKVPKDDKWKKKYKEPEPIASKDLPAIPKTWTWTPLSELGELNRGKSKHRPRKDPVLFGGDYPFIQTGDIRAADGILTTFSQTYNEFGLKQSRLWDEGTLCITIAANIADTAILGIPACFPDSVVGLLPDSSICDVRFIEYFIRTAKHNLESFAPATAQKNINLEILKVLAIPFISLEEQKEIVRRIESLFKLADSIEQQYQQAEVDLETLNQSILAKAFRGELVPQDPNDEPASVLLERIKKERDKAKATAKKSGVAGLRYDCLTCDR